MKCLLNVVGVTMITAALVTGESSGDLRRWFAAAMGLILGAALLFIIADLIPDRRYRRRKRRTHCRQNPRQVRTLQPANEEETVWF